MKKMFGLLFLLSSAVGFSQTVPDQWLTPYEKSEFRKTPRYAETMEYCKKLQTASPWIKVTSFGRSPGGRELPLVIASKDRAFTPATAAKSGKAILLIQNAIHAGEMDGKDACLMLLRDMVITKTKSSLLDHVTILIIPIYNVDGHERFGPYNRINQNGPEEMGWRVTAQNLNLNRDYVKADAPETQAWLKLFNEWLPDFFIDAHVTDGVDHQYVITWSMEYHTIAAPSVRAWIREKYLPAVIERVNANGVIMQPYQFFGLNDSKDPSKGGVAGSGPPRFATGYVPIQNRPALLIEAHMLKDYKSRVEGTYKLIEETVRRMNEEYASLRASVREADRQTATALENPFPLQVELAQVPSDTVDFLGYKTIVEKSPISGADRVTYTRDPMHMRIPLYDSVTVTKTVTPPIAYLIPPQWQEVIARLRLHGVKMERLKEPANIIAERYRFSNAKWQSKPFEGRLPVTYSIQKSVEKDSFPAGTVVVHMNQRAAKVAIHCLEPEGPDALVQWGFFNAVFEQKEYAEDYVMEKYAGDMLKSDPKLRIEFDSKVESDTAFAHNPDARLHFFYERSPYWDAQINLYPVARILTAIPLKTEPFP